MAELQQRLQAAVGDAYRIERELGGGGMSRVFVAEDVELGRRVVIKVLPPEMAAGVNQERFRREIQLAAKLQHPHVVPLLTAGAHEDLLYYVMPFIKGESLRAKLAREGELPIGEALRILRDVADALSYAHREGVVHRDIKPDNVLLSDNHAVVTDFGVAKAVSASTGESSLTSLGVALGTPAYMSPEQAAADPHVDHRADIYAVGALAYEMLSGRPPFSGPNPQAVLSAHVTQAPEPVTVYREMVPASLNELVMRCLAKKPADRWQKADELRAHFEAMTTPSGGITPTGTAPVPAVDYEALARQAHPIRVAVLFGLGSAVVLALVYFIMFQLGLPDWVFVGAVILLAIGLPIMLMTGHHERQRALASTTGVVVATPQQGIRRWFTWRKSLVGGGLAFAGLGVVATGYMAMRMLGVGPAATLVTSGVLEQRGRLVVADFENRTRDTTLGPSVTEAFRIDLSQSPVVKLMDATAVSRVLERMEREPGPAMDLALAREVAEREGAKAVVAGEISPLGDGFVLSARLLSTSSGEEFVALRETAKNRAGIIDAVDRLSAKLRERIGESLRTIRANEPLEGVTTASLEALRKYSRAFQAHGKGEYDRAVSLLEEAIALDSGFAMAYRRLAASLGQARAEVSRIRTAATKAFEHRDRLPDLERYLAEAYYYGTTFDRDNAIAAYHSALELDPENSIALNNLGTQLWRRRQWEEAEELLERAMATGETGTPYGTAVSVHVAQGEFAEAHAIVERFAEDWPEHPNVLGMRAQLAASRGDYERAQEHFASLARDHRAVRWQDQALGGLVDLAELEGRLADAERHHSAAVARFAEEGLRDEALQWEVEQAIVEVDFGAMSQGVRRVESALARYPLDSMSPYDRPYLPLASIYARTGRLEEAHRLLAAFDAIDEAARRLPFRHIALGDIAFAEKRYDDAAVAYRAWNEAWCPRCGLFDLARTYDAAGQADSALVFYERHVTTPALGVGPRRSQSYKRLGELYEERGEREKAVENYNEFIELWKEADPELQPVVREVRARIARLVGER